jgi:hypothetical protein
MHPVALPLLAALSLLPPPDLVVAGVRSVAIESHLDASVLARTHCLAHVVGKDETLMAIAQLRLGDAGRWQQIEQLNPGLDPTRLQIGQLLWLPPADPKVAAAEPATRMFVYSDAEDGHQRTVRPLVVGAQLAVGRQGGMFRIYLVPAAEQASFEAEWRRRGPGWKLPEGVQKQIDARLVTQLVAKNADHSVPTEHPMVRRVDRHVVEAKGDGSFAIGCKSTGFDKNGKEVSVEVPAKQREDALLLLLLAAAGGGALLWRARRPELAPA